MNEVYLYSLIIEPYITEKTNLLLTKSNKLVFIVRDNCNKHSLKKSFELVFNVLIENINIVNVSGKKKLFKGRIGFRSDFKKAIVTLKKGYSLDYSKFSEGV